MTEQTLATDSFPGTMAWQFLKICVPALVLTTLAFTGLAPASLANTNRRHRQQALGTLSGSSASFGNVPVGSLATKTITVRNSGSASVTISGASASAAEFSMNALSLPMTLQAGATVSLAATFAPTVAGSASGTILITSNASNPSLTIPLSGTGTATASTDVLTADPTSVTFGDVGVGQSTFANIVLANTGSSAVTISQVIAPGAPYTVSGVTPNQTLAAGQSVTISLTFAPTTTGSFTGTTTIASTATNSPLSIAIAGGSHAVSLSWTASTSSVVGYNVYRGTISGGPYTLKLNAAPVTGTTYTDAAVASGQGYYYVVTAVDAAGTESAYSTQASATIPTP